MERGTRYTVVIGQRSGTGAIAGTSGEWRIWVNALSATIICSF